MSSSDDLPLADYDQMAIGDLQHRIRALTKGELEMVLNHEAGHAARVPVLEILEARLRQLEDGAEPSPGDPRRAPGAQSTPGGSPVQESTAAEGTRPPRHGTPSQSPKP